MAKLSRHGLCSGQKLEGEIAMTLGGQVTTVRRHLARTVSK